MMNEKAPKQKISTERPVRNEVAWVEAPTVMPMRRVQMLTMALLATSLRRLVTPHSFNRLPKKSIPSRGRPEGTMKAQKSRPTMGKVIFSSLET